MVASASASPLIKEMTSSRQPITEMHQRLKQRNRKIGDEVPEVQPKQQPKQQPKKQPKQQPKKQLIGYRGNWYDVSNFMDRHPGGDVIRKFVGEDATSVMDSFHGKDVVKYWKPDSSFEPEADGFEEEMRELERFLTENGYYDNSVPWYMGKCLLVIALFAVITGTSVAGISALNAGTMFASGLLLALLWQQSGMLMHDAMHLQITREKKTDERIGLLFGSVLFGISAHWWKDEHIVHHALTNTVDDEKCIDPQGDEICFAQNQLLFPIRMQNKLSSLLCTIQSWTFFPFVVCLGRIGITIDSMREERRADVWLAWLLHVMWLSLYFRTFPTWWSCGVVYGLGCIGEGVLHIQLIINHYAKQFYKLEERQPQKHYRYMVECNLNIICPRHMDWFHGGLNFHHEHHCFPRLPRNRLREVSPMIRERCRRFDIDYDEIGFFEAVHKTMTQIRRMQISFVNLDIRK